MIRVFIHKFNGSVIPIEWHTTQRKYNHWTNGPRQHNGYTVNVIGKYSYMRFTGIAEVINGQIEQVNDVNRIICD